MAVLDGCSNGGSTQPLQQQAQQVVKGDDTDLAVRVRLLGNPSERACKAESGGRESSAESGEISSDSDAPEEGEIALSTPTSSKRPQSAAGTQPHASPSVRSLDSSRSSSGRLQDGDRRAGGELPACSEDATDSDQENPPNKRQRLDPGNTQEPADGSPPCSSSVACSPTAAARGKRELAGLRIESINLNSPRTQRLAARQATLFTSGSAPLRKGTQQDAPDTLPPKDGESASSDRTAAFPHVPSDNLSDLVSNERSCSPEQQQVALQQLQAVVAAAAAAAATAQAAEQQLHAEPLPSTSKGSLVGGLLLDCMPSLQPCTSQQQPLQQGQPAASGDSALQQQRPVRARRQVRRRRMDFSSFRFPWQLGYSLDGADVDAKPMDLQPELNMSAVAAPAAPAVSVAAVLPALASDMLLPWQQRRQQEVNCGPRVSLKLSAKGVSVQRHLTPPIALRKGCRALCSGDGNGCSAAVCNAAVPASGCPPHQQAAHGEDCTLLGPLLKLVQCQLEVEATRAEPYSSTPLHQPAGVATQPAKAGSKPRASSSSPPAASTMFGSACNFLMRSQFPGSSRRGAAEPGDRVLSHMRADGVPPEPADQLAAALPAALQSRQQMVRDVLQTCNTWLA